MTYTVFGHTGMIGSALVAELTEQKEEVILPRREEYRLEQNLGHVIYCIGLTADFRSKPHATIDAHVNHLNKVLKHNNFESFLYLSSTRVYQHCDHGNENRAIKLNSQDADQLYNISKLAGESLCLQDKRKNVRVARLSNVVSAEKAGNNFLDQIIHSVLRNGNVTINQAADSAKDYISIDDVVRLLLDISTSGQQRLYNIASGQNTSHGAIAEILRETLKVRVEFLPSSPCIQFPNIQISKIKSEFDYQPKNAVQMLQNLIKQRLESSHELVSGYA